MITSHKELSAQEVLSVVLHKVADGQEFLIRYAVGSLSFIKRLTTITDHTFLIILDLAHYT